MKWLILLVVLASCGPSVQELNSSIPRDLSWAAIDLDGDGIDENYVPSIKKQSCSDCYIQSTLGLLETQFQIDHGVGPVLNLSEQNIHNCLRIRCDYAGDQSWILEYIKDYGVLEEEYAPNGFWWGCHNCAGSLISSLGTVSVSTLPFYTFDEYEEVISPKVEYSDRKNIMLKALQFGPLAVGIDGFAGFKDDGGILYCKENKPCGHSAMVVGYINYGEIFLIKGSYGEKQLLKFAFKGADKCGFANWAHRILPGSTHISFGKGKKFCYAVDDWDYDGIPLPYDNCPYISNPEQKNSDLDLLGDECDPCSGFNPIDMFYCPERK